MEKKGNRNLQSSSRGLATDSKKNQDVVSGKLWPRSSRRREPAGSTLASKGEPSRKPQPQRAKNIDKRPKPRGSYYGGAVGRYETAKLDLEQEAELGSVFLPGSKKQSLNHLLNFVYAPREGFAPERGNSKNSGRLIATKKHKYNKEHFLQANCQFIVKSSGDYKQYLNNPDALVDWNLIEQVNVQVSEYPACPICLYPPVAGKMTRCGHIYCWSCILHYLSLTDKTYRKCPICYESVHKEDLKSVVTIPHHTFNLNETITFKLMKRPKGSLIAYPADANIKAENVIFNMLEQGVNEIYSKLLIANNNDIMSIIERERKELNNQLNEDENAPERCFIEEAINLLMERNKIFESVCNTGNKMESDSEEFEELSRTMEKLDVANSNEAKLYQKNYEMQETSGQQPKFHYFYQASDGQHIYLHAINARMLEHTYGSLEFGPKTVTGKILEKEGGSMTEELRNRLRYLQHLPVTCQFEVAEIHLKQPVINKETLEHFQEQVDVRRKRRQRRAKEEKKREKKIAEEENRQMGKYPAANIHLDSPSQFPEFGFEPRLRSESEGTQFSDGTSETSSGINFGSLPNEHAISGPSFAKMLSTEKKPQPEWPGLKTKTIDAPKLINVTGAQMKSNVIATKRNDDSDTELEGFEPIQSLSRSFGEAIAQALKNAEEVDVTPTSGKKKKKKNKPKVLFTTNVAISGNQ